MPSEIRKILISGSHGLVGTALASALRDAGQEAVALRRNSSGAGGGGIVWDPGAEFSREQRDKLEGIDAVVHLAGESIMGLWTREKRRRIRESRVMGTRRLCEALAETNRKPAVVVSASASGFYGDRGDELLDESSPRGTGFLADVAGEWEAATEAASRVGIRVVHLRLGVVLTPKGGALRAMLLPFRLGLGGRLGNGRQYVSWIALNDVVGLIRLALAKGDLAGPMNASAPNPLTNAELTRTLAKVLGRPVGPPAPAFVLRTFLGTMAGEVLLSSCRMKPRRAMENGYKFAMPELDDALRRLLAGSGVQR